jgi:hypothetical protein
MTNILITYCDETRDDTTVLKCRTLAELCPAIKEEIFEQLLRENDKTLKPYLKKFGYFKEEEIKNSKGIRFSNKDSVEFRCGSYSESVSQDGKLSSSFLDRIYNSGGSACFARIPILENFAEQINRHKQIKDSEKEKRKRKKEEKAIEKARLLLAKSESTP